MADTDQVLKLAAIIREVDGNHSKGAAALAELILDHPSFHQCCNAPAPPADGGVAELVEWLRRIGPCNDEEAANLNRTGKLLQRQALVPVSVSERLPGPGDCLPWPGEPNAGHWCWAFIKGPLDDDSWERRPVTCLTTYKPMHSHWLPANALPLPEVGE